MSFSLPLWPLTWLPQSSPDSPLIRRPQREPLPFQLQPPTPQEKLPPPVPSSPRKVALFEEIPSWGFLLLSSEVSPLLGDFPFLGVSFIGGSTVILFGLSLHETDKPLHKVFSGTKVLSLTAWPPPMICRIRERKESQCLNCTGLFFNGEVFF